MKAPRLALALLAGFALQPAARSSPVRDVDTSPVDPPSLDITRAELFRAAEGRLVFVLTFRGAADAARVRVLVDTDGPARGEPETGADWLFDAGRFFRYPAGGTGWTWDEVRGARMDEDGRLLYCFTPAGLELRAGRWIVETTGPDLSPADRLPGEGGLEFDVNALPAFAPASEPGSNALPAAPAGLRLSGGAEAAGTPEDASFNLRLGVSYPADAAPAPAEDPDAGP